MRLLILGLHIIVLGVLIWLAVLAMVRPRPIVRCWGLLLHRLDHLARPIEPNGESVRLYNQLCNNIILLSAYLGKVAANLLLPLVVGLVLIRPLRYLFRLYKVFMEGAEVDTRCPYCARPL